MKIFNKIITCSIVLLSAMILEQKIQALGGLVESVGQAAADVTGAAVGTAADITDGPYYYGRPIEGPVVYKGPVIVEEEEEEPIETTYEYKEETKVE